MSLKGKINIDRAIQNHWLYDEKPLCKVAAWYDLIMLANFAPGKVKIKSKFIELDRGELFTSLRELGDRWGWTKDKVESFLQLLESDDMVCQDIRHDGRQLKINNYDEYQYSGRQADRHTPDSGPTLTLLKSSGDATFEDSKKNKKKDNLNIQQQTSNNKIDKCQTSNVVNIDIIEKNTDQSVVVVSDKVQGLLKGWNVDLNDLLNKYDPAFIAEKVELTVRSRAINKAGFLIKSLEKDYKAPAAETNKLETLNTPENRAMLNRLWCDGSKHALFYELQKIIVAENKAAYDDFVKKTSLKPAMGSW